MEVKLPMNYGKYTWGQAVLSLLGPPPLLLVPFGALAADSFNGETPNRRGGQLADNSRLQAKHRGSDHCNCGTLLVRF